MGSFCASTIRIILCLAPELNATPCWDGVYLEKEEITLIPTYIPTFCGSDVCNQIFE